jgi:hypothetical protein
MPLSDFFRINLPYGMEKNANNEWFAFNREYVPLGWNTKDSSFFNEMKTNGELPIHTKFKGLTDNAISKIITNPDRVQKNKAGEIVTVFFYNDATNPQSKPQYWDDYFAIIKELSKFEKSSK